MSQTIISILSIDFYEKEQKSQSGKAAFLFFGNVVS